MSDFIKRQYIRRKKSTDIPSYITPTDNPLVDFKSIYYSYYIQPKFKGSERYKSILERRINKEEILESIGNSEGLSRERVRQIVEAQKNKFNTLFEGGCLCTPCVTLNINYISCINKFKEYVHTKPIHTKEDILKYLNENFTEPTLEEDVNGYLKLLMFMLGYDHYTLTVEGIDLYVDTKKINSYGGLLEYRSTIKEVLHKNILPMSVFDIAKKGRLNVALTGSLLPILDISEKTGEDVYQLKYEQFSNVTDILYRILKNAGSPMTLPEIVSALGTLMDNYSSPDYLSTRMILDDRFCAVGHKATYGLTEWGLDTRNFKEIIVDTLKAMRKPSTPENINLASNSRVSANVIRCYVNSYPNIFKRVSDKKIGLTAWKNYEKVPSSRRGASVSQYKFEEELLKILTVDPSKSFISMYLYVYFKNSISEHVFYDKLELCPFIDIIRGSRNSIKLKSNYKEILEKHNKIKAIRKANSIEGLIEEAVKILEPLDGMVMKDLVKKLKMYDVSKPTIYRALEVGPFIKKTVVGVKYNTKIIELQRS
jgi:hypothetical protein